MRGGEWWGCCPKSSVKIGTAVDEIKLSATPQTAAAMGNFRCGEEKTRCEGQKGLTNIENIYCNSELIQSEGGGGSGGSGGSSSSSSGGSGGGSGGGANIAAFNCFSSSSTLSAAERMSFKLAIVDAAFSFSIFS